MYNGAKRKHREAESVQPSVSKNKKCSFCGVSETPMWRKGPQGAHSLCNACGVRWSLSSRKRHAATTQVEASSDEWHNHSRDDDVTARVPAHSLSNPPGSAGSSGSSGDGSSEDDEVGRSMLHAERRGLLFVPDCVPSPTIFFRRLVTVAEEQAQAEEALAKLKDDVAQLKASAAKMAAVRYSEDLAEALRTTCDSYRDDVLGSLQQAKIDLLQVVDISKQSGSGLEDLGRLIESKFEELHQAALRASAQCTISVGRRVDALNTSALEDVRRVQNGIDAVEQACEECSGCLFL